MKIKSKKIHLLPNVITAFGLSCGLFVIFKLTMMGVGEMTPHALTALVGVLLLAAIADLLDGAVARAVKAESAFGGIFDSLQDAISFGVAPSVMVLKTLSLPAGTKWSFFIATAAMIYSVCGVLRLVRFNVIAMESQDNQDLLLANKKHFTGLPIPAAAAAAISMNLFLFSDEFKSMIDLSVNARAGILAFTLIFLGYCMVSRWKFPSTKSLEIKVISFNMIFLTVVCAVLTVYGILHFFSFVFFVFSWSYVMIALSLAIIRKIAGRKSKTLEEFEPEPDELEDDLGT